ncbi:MAG: hypothetical protein WC763_07465, partial [Candidatus Paceibacterota bacterium]
MPHKDGPLHARVGRRVHLPLSGVQKIRDIVRPGLHEGDDLTSAGSVVALPSFGEIQRRQKCNAARLRLRPPRLFVGSAKSAALVPSAARW